MSELTCSSGTADLEPAGADPAPIDPRLEVHRMLAALHGVPVEELSEGLVDSEVVPDGRP
jgi:hypothetical protein